MRVWPKCNEIVIALQFEIHITFCWQRESMAEQDRDSKMKGCESERVRSQLSHLFNQEEDNLFFQGKSQARRQQTKTKVLNLRSILKGAFVRLLENTDECKSKWKLWSRMDFLHLISWITAGRGDVNKSGRAPTLSIAPHLRVAEKRQSRSAVRTDSFTTSNSCRTTILSVRTAKR